MATSSHLEEGIDVTSGARVLECVVVVLLRMLTVFVVKLLKVLN